MNTWNEKPKGLRVIKTARTEKAINKAVEEGYWPLVKKVEPSPEIKSKYAVLQNNTTGQIEVVYDFREIGNSEMSTVIDFTYYYPHHFPSPFAAYLIPADLEVGETVWIEDLIEDLVASRWNQGDVFRLKSAEAIWSGADLIVKFDNTVVSEIVG